MMSLTAENIWFYVVQFKDLPFVGIHDYVCVPRIWAVVRISKEKKVTVTYPSNEDPLETRERVKRHERPNDSWGFYEAYVKYPSENFEDADLWIARQEFGTNKKESKPKDTKSVPQLKRKLQNANQSCGPGSNLDDLQVTVKRAKRIRRPLPRISIRRPLPQASNENLNYKSALVNENTIRKSDKNKRIWFYVVQFIELPFVGIHDYVCVPRSWVFSMQTQNQKVTVTYPDNEDPLETRERVRKKERPNDSWRIYVAYVKYQSGKFADADLWVNGEFKGGTDGKESKQKDTKSVPKLKRKLRNANQSCGPGSNLDDLQITMKREKRIRKPLPRISIRRPSSQESSENLNNKCFMLNENPKPVVITDHITAASGSSKQEQSIIITSNQVIQKGQTNSTYPSNGEMNTKRSTQPEAIKENQSIDLSVQSTSAKLPVEHQLSSQLPTEQQLSLQPSTGREPSPQPPVDRQPLPKSIVEQHPSPKFSDEQQPSFIGQGYQHPVSMSAVEMNNCKGNVDSCQNVLPEPVTDKIPSTKTPPNTFKPAPQSDPIIERPTPLVRYEYSLEVIKENQPLDLSVQSTSAKLPVEHQLSSQLPNEQQLSLQPSTGREPSPQCPVDRQLLPKSIVEQHPSSKFSDEQQPSFIGQGYQHPVSMSAVEMNNSKGNIDSCQNVLPEPVTDKIPSTKTPPYTFKPAPQSDPIIERPTPLVRLENSLPEPQSGDVTAGQSKEPNHYQKTQFHWMLIAPHLVPRPPNTTKQPFQQCGSPQLPIISVNSTLNSKFQTQKFGERNCMEAADNHSFLHSQDIIASMPSTSHHEYTSKKLNQMSTLKARQQSSAVNKVENPVDNTSRLEGFTKNIATLQYPPKSMTQLIIPGGSTVAQSVQFTQHQVQQAQIDVSLTNDDRRGKRENYISQRDPRAQVMMNTPAAQNLSKLAHQYNPILGTSQYEQQCLMTQEDYLQQFKRHQDMIRSPTMTSTLDPMVYHQSAMMNRGFVIQSQPNSINQPIQFLPQNVNQYVPNNSAYLHKPKSHEVMKKYTDGAHVTYKPVAPKEVDIQFPTNQSSSQSHWDAEHSQKKQDQQNDPRTKNTPNDLPLKSTHSSLILKPQKDTKRSRSLSVSKAKASQALFDAQRNCLIQELNIQERVNQSSTKPNNTNLAAISETQTVELASSTRNIAVQPMLSSNEIQATQFTLIQKEHHCQCSGIKKNMIDQATQMDSMMDDSQSVEAIAGSSIGSARKMDELLDEQQDSLYQETSSESEDSTDSEIESENDFVPETNQATPTAEQNLTQENQHDQSRIIIEQDMLHVIGNLVTQMGSHVSLSFDKFNTLRNSLLVCEQTYKTLLKLVYNIEFIEPQNSPSPQNNVISQDTQGIPVNDYDNTTSVGNATTSIREQRGTLFLPAEFDLNDTKWTLKYREKRPGIVELIPRTGVYVKKKELQRCIRKSNDCRTLARLLLTEVFSHVGLGVCSWTGRKAKAFNSVNIDVRPGLDENARNVLLTFVEEYGKKLGWKMAISAVMSTIRTKIYDIRDKYVRKCKVH